MRKPLLLFSILIALIASVAQADTIHLKNGSLLKGKVTSFADDQFVVMLDTGSGRYLSKAMVYVGDVARIEFDSTTTASLDAGPSRDTTVATQPSEPPASVSSQKDIQRDPSSTETEPRSHPPGEGPAKRTQPVEPPRETSQAEPQPSSAQPKEAEPQPEKPVEKDPPLVTATDVSEPSDADRVNRKLSGSVRTVSVDVMGKRDWTSTGLIVKRGDRIRITATGAVTLDPAGGRASGPEGIADLADPKKLMPDETTGALIGVIGADNDDFIFIGRSSDFTAARDGLLFLSVNEGTLSDNTGTFRAVIEVQAQRKQ